MTEMSPAEAVFFAALAIPDRADRAAYLDQACAGDPALRARVEKLLAAHPDAGGFLAPPSGDDTRTALQATIEHADRELAGTVLAGRYTLTECVGEGGMGEVWVARQTEPVQRKVAVKLIRAGMDSRNVLARFEAERQALALMDHPNIAKVLDGGLTPAGHPFFVMELVKGIPITKFCDERKLTPKERLELFVPVCHAIQHAHQKGIIHRDIKPSNVLVALYDDKPVPKVIDFGVAKAAGQPLTDKTLETAFGSVVGTPQYMSPEQATFNNLDIDTRSDVYSLGVLLYELLAGSPPFSKTELAKVGLLEVLRVVREEDPPRPSAKLSTADALPSLAATRGTEPKKLTGLLRSELDWVVMKAMEKDRSRRYETANGFAADVQRYLAGEPVVAHPPKPGYRLKKFLRRNRGPVVAASVVFVALAAGVVGTASGLVEARHQKQAALAAAEEERRAKQEADLKRLEAEAARAQAQRRLTQVEKGVDLFAGLVRGVDPRAEEKGAPPLYEQLRERAAKAADKLAGESVGDPQAMARLQSLLGSTLTELGETSKAIDLLEQARTSQEANLGADHPDTLDTLNNLAAAYLRAGNFPKAIALFERVRDGGVKKRGADHSDTLAALNNLAVAYQEAGRLSEALPLLERVADVSVRKLGPDHRQALGALVNLAGAYVAAGRPAEAIPRLERARDAQVRTLGPEHSETLTTCHNLATAYLEAGRLREAVELFEQARDTLVRKLGSDHPSSLIAGKSLARAYVEADRQREAVALFERLRDPLVQKLGPDHPDTLDAMDFLARAYLNAGRLSEATGLLERVRDTRAKNLGPDHPGTLTALNNLARAYWEAGKRPEAVALFEQVHTARVKKLGPKHPYTLTTVDDLARAYRQMGKVSEAIALLEQVRNTYVETLGPDHPQTLTSLSNLGRSYLEAGRLSEALALLEQVRDAQVKRRGTDHRDTLATQDHLAAAYRRAGRVREAIALLEQARDAETRELGAHHPDTLATLNHLALAYQEGGRLPEALALFERIRDAMVKYRGADHPNTLMTMDNLAKAYMAADRLPEAVALVERVREARERKFGADHPDTLAAWNNLAILYQRSGRMPEAIAILERVRDAELKILGADHGNTLNTLTNLSLAYRRGGKLTEAIALLEQLRAIQTKKLGPDHPDTLGTLDNLGLAYQEAKRLPEAIALLEQAAAGVEKGRFRHPNAGGIIGDLAAASDQAKQFDRAEAWRRKWLAVVKDRTGADSPAYAGELAALGMSLLQREKWVEAEAALRESLAVREMAQPDAWNTFNTRSMLGGALLGQKKYADAEPLLRAGYAGMKERADKIPPVAKPRLGEAIDRLVQLAEALGNKDEAARWRAEKGK